MVSNLHASSSYHYSFHYQLACYDRIADNLRIYNHPVGDKPSYTNCLWPGLCYHHIEISRDIHQTSFPFLSGLYFLRLQIFQNNFNLGVSHFRIKDAWRLLNVLFKIVSTHCLRHCRLHCTYFKTTANSCHLNIGSALARF